MMRRFVALLLRLFPADFQRTFAADMLAAFEDRWSERQGVCAAIRITADLLRSAALEWAAQLRRREIQSAKGERVMLTLAQDLRFAVRLLRRTPGFTVTAIAVLALGIGAVSAIFSLVDAVLLRPLPFPHAEQLVELWEHRPGYAHNNVAPLNFADWNAQNRSFRAMAAVAGAPRTLHGANGVERIPGEAVTTSFFDLLGIRPVAGRLFTVADGRPGEKIVLLSEGLWRSHFGGDPALIGQTIELDNVPYTVVGVVPAAFQMFYKSDLWTVFIPGRGPELRAEHYLKVIGRLKPDVTRAQAGADMAMVAAGIARISPRTNQGWGVTIEPLHDALIGSDVRTTAAVLSAVVGLVLLMACANVANLLLARGAARGREFAVRASLGGSRARILRQLLSESALLAALGGAAGLLLGWLILRAAPHYLPPGILPIELALKMNGRVLGFAALLTCAASVLFGFAPAWCASRISLADAMRAGGRTVSARVGAFRGLLSTAEIAVAVLLVTGAGLLVRTMISLRGADPGFHARNVLTMYVGLPLTRYPTPESTLHFYQAAEREIRRIPGVQQVGLGGSLPLDGWDIGQGFSVVGTPDVPGASRPSAHYQIVSAHYFAALGIDVLRGRPFSEHDTASSKPVCIVNQEMVRHYLNGKDPIGASLRVAAMAAEGPRMVVREIVGVIRQVKVEGLGEKQDNPEIYVPIAQNPWYSASIVVRTAGDPLLSASAVRAAIARVDRDEAVTRVRTMQEVAADSVAEPRFRAQLVGAFAAIAVLLASVGIFGVLAFSVGRRTREFGIRMALGARWGDIIGLVLKSGLKMIAAGVAAGVSAALLLTRWLAALLYGVQPFDPLTFLVTPLLLSAVAMAASLLPALRAAGVDPGVALHHE